MLRSLVFAVVGMMALSAYGSDSNIRKVISPYIKGDTLYIEGTIDSHIYDYLSYEAKKIKQVKTISLNSYGGSSDWGLDIGARIQELGKDTLLESGNVCASACLYVFASGKNRRAETGTWFGLHGARITKGYAVTFSQLCFEPQKEGGLQYVSERPGCQNFVEKMHDIAMEATNRAFDLMEQAGVSGELRDYYYSLEDDPDWPYFGNVIRKPDEVLSAQKALRFNLVTELTDPIN